MMEEEDRWRFVPARGTSGNWSSGKGEEEEESINLSDVSSELMLPRRCSGASFSFDSNSMYISVFAATLACCSASSGELPRLNNVGSKTSTLTVFIMTHPPMDTASLTDWEPLSGPSDVVMGSGGEGGDLFPSRSCVIVNWKFLKESLTSSRKRSWSRSSVTWRGCGRWRMKDTLGHAGASDARARRGGGNSHSRRGKSRTNCLGLSVAS